ncbi:MAG: hypothetical protein M3R08_07935, partial [Bacteroidota bacterium]|nr:hypothetical protein [Bacteroidota bacterium]
MITYIYNMRNILISTLFLSGFLTPTHGQWEPGLPYLPSGHFVASAFHHPDTGIFAYGNEVNDMSIYATFNGAEGPGYVILSAYLRIKDVAVRMVNDKPFYVAAGRYRHAAFEAPPSRSIIIRPIDHLNDPFELDTVLVGGPWRVFRCIAFASDEVLFAGGGQGQFTLSGIIDRSDDGGILWSTIAEFPGVVTKLKFVDEQTGFACTNGYEWHFWPACAPGAGEIYKTMDSGSSWVLVHGEEETGIADIAFWNDSHGLALTNDGRVLRSIDSGTTWAAGGVIPFETLGYG